MQLLIGLREFYAQNCLKIWWWSLYLQLPRFLHWLSKKNINELLILGIFFFLVCFVFFFFFFLNWHWGIDNSISLSSATTSINNFTPKPKCDRPLYFHYGLQGYTIDKCFKLHGSPLRYKNKPKPPPINA